jgi:hypothetical protein
VKPEHRGTSRAPKHTSISRASALLRPESIGVLERRTLPHALAMGRAHHGKALIGGAGTSRGEKECALYFALTRDASHDR